MKRLAIFSIFLLIALVSFGCLGNWRTIAEPANASGPVGATVSGGQPNSVGYMYVTRQYGYSSDDDWYEVSFTLEDANRNVVTASGTLLVTMKDSKGNIIYRKQESVLASDFEESTSYPFYGNKVYAHKAYFNEINKSSSYYVNVTMEFTPTGGSVISRTKKDTYLTSTLVNSSSSSSTYGTTNYKTINMSSTQSDLQVTLVKGNLSKSSYSSYSYYYAYLDFKNLGTKRKAVTISDVTIVVNGQQYDSSLSSYSKSLLSSLGNVYPGATLSKQLTFYNVPKTTSPMTMYIELKVAEDGQNQTLSYQFTYNQ